MTLLKIEKSGKRDAKVEEILSGFQSNLGIVPKPLEMLAVSPDLFNIQYNSIGYFSNHKKLNFGLLACIRYLTAKKLDFEACIEFNGKLLEKQGMTVSEIGRLIEDTSTAPLEDGEKLLLDFVMKSLDGKITSQDMEELRLAGWSDSDIFDAVSHSFSLIPMGKMMNLFQFS